MWHLQITSSETLVKNVILFLETVAVRLWHTRYLMVVEEKEVKYSIVIFLHRLPPSCPCELCRASMDTLTSLSVKCNLTFSLKASRDIQIHKFSSHSPPFSLMECLRALVSQHSTDNKTPFNSLSYELCFQRHCIFTGILLQKLSRFNFFRFSSLALCNAPKIFLSAS